MNCLSFALMSSLSRDTAPKHMITDKILRLEIYVPISHIDA